MQSVHNKSINFAEGKEKLTNQQHNRKKLNPNTYIGMRKWHIYVAIICVGGKKSSVGVRKQIY